MAQTRQADICIIGAGSGGLSVAAGTAQLGLKTVLIEPGKMGGDCLNTGCVPSKALLEAGKRAQIHRKTDIKGISGHEPEIDFTAVKDHITETIKTIEPHDSQERFESLGVTVIREAARFTGPDTIQAGEHLIKARYFVIATGSRPVIPPISGLDKDNILTNENIFSLRDRPDHLLVIGGGPIGIEMAQAHRRLGCKVSVFDMGNILPRDDQDNVDILRAVLRDEGIDLYEQADIKNIEHSGTTVSLNIEYGDQAQNISGSHLFIAAGRAPVTGGLDLENAGIKYDHKGIGVDRHLRSSNKKIYAIGDVAGGPQFTHVAGYHAGIIIRQLCFKLFWAKTDYSALPWVTYSDPELAQVGLTESQARKKHGDKVKTVEARFDGNDRAISARKTTGQIRVITDHKGRILGASIVGPDAGELISLWALTIGSKQKISAIAGMIVPYPTMTEISKRAAGAWYTPRLFSDKTKRIVGLLQKLPY
jgi:pyruvate/2-oxoglutarate dehydrogenase complex dihydrolipoamide dehydrogenase (E3) component